MNHIGEFTRRDRAQIGVALEHFRGIQGRDTQGLGRGYTGLHIHLQFTMQGEPRQVVGAGNQRDARVVQQFDHS